MSVINSQPLIGASGNQSTAYNLTRSLRFRSSASAYLNRTPASAGNRKTWTWSAWVKRGSFTTTRQCLFGGWSSDSDSNWLEFGFGGSTDGDTNDSFYVTTATVGINSSAVFRDPSAWYHVVVVVDTTQATAANRFRLWINGVNQNLSALSSLSLNLDAGVNQASNHSVSKSPKTGTTRQFDGYMAENHFIDGQALTPSDFGETDTATGVWKPKKYTGTYGTNGFYLKFDNLTSTSTLGNDSSGNSNTWTVNNISLTSGSTYDSMKDVPTLTDADTANYAVLNPLFDASVSNSNANLQTVLGTGTISSVPATMGFSSGKYYCEITYVATGSSGLTVGVTQSHLSTANQSNWSAGGVGYRSNNGNSNTNGAGQVAYGATWTTGDVIGIAVDADGGTITFYKNNTSQGSLNLPTLTSGSNWLFSFTNITSAGTQTMAANFGQQPFAYTPPSGFKALNTFNLPTPTIGATASTQANKYMNVVTYTGTGSSQSITGVGFQPDWTWIKGRSGATDHGLYDAVRGVQKQIESNNTDAETTETTGLTAFGSDGFTVGALAQLNTSSATYVGWNWKANGSGSTNTSGSITSTVSANTTAGFSIVTYTGTGANATVGHGLGVAPSMIIVKRRSTSGSNWITYHSSLANPSGNYLSLNTTDAAINDNTAWNNTNPTSSVFSLGTLAAGNLNTGTFVAYCFAQVAGYSAFGSYTGNGSTDGTFVFTGFRPKYILIKRTDDAYSWWINDSARDPYNVVGQDLAANLSQAESSDAPVQDFLSNGFKLRTSAYPGFNANGGTYIYAAFAETPFKYSLAR